MVVVAVPMAVQLLFRQVRDIVLNYEWIYNVRCADPYGVLVCEYACEAVAAYYLVIVIGCLDIQAAVVLNCS